MENLELLKEDIENRLNKIEQDTKSFREEFISRIERLKTDQVLMAIKSLSDRFDAIEARLPEIEEDID